MSNGLQSYSKKAFRHFREFVSNVFLKITYHDSLGQRLTSSRDKNYEKIVRGPNGPKSGPKLGCLLFSQV